MTCPQPSTKHFGARRLASGGYSLFEMMAVMLILGLGLTAASQMIADYYREKQSLEQLRRMDTVVEAISSYVHDNGYYPCVAPIDKGPADGAAYGDELNCNDVAVTGVAVGNCGADMDNINIANQALCVRAGARNAGNKVLVGSVPFKTLGLDEKFGYDIRGVRLTYVVTHALTQDANSATAGEGEIGVYNTATPPPPAGGGPTYTFAAGDTLTGKTGTAHFVLISHGVDTKGAFMKTASARVDCPNTAPALDRVNCDASGTSANYVMRSTTTTADANYFDDDVRFIIQRNAQLWRTNAAGNLLLNGRNSLMIGSAIPNVTVNIDKVVRNKSGTPVTVGMLCDKNAGSDDSCFDPKVIGGAAPDPANANFVANTNMTEPYDPDPQIETNGGVVCPGGSNGMGGMKNSNNALGAEPDCKEKTLICPIAGEVVIATKNGSLICDKISGAVNALPTLNINSPGLNPAGGLQDGVNSGDKITFTVTLAAPAVEEQGIGFSYETFSPTTGVQGTDVPACVQPACRPGTGVANAGVNGADYQTTSGQKQFNVGGPTSIQIEVSTLGQAGNVPQRVVGLRIYNVTGATAGITKGIGTIKAIGAANVLCGQVEKTIWEVDGVVVGCDQPTTVMLPESPVGTIKNNIKNCNDTNFNNFPQSVLAPGCRMILLPDGTNWVNKVDVPCPTKGTYSATYKCVNKNNVGTWVETGGRFVGEP